LYISNRQIQEHLGFQLFAENIRTLFTLGGNFEGTDAKQGLIEVTHGQPGRADAWQASSGCA
jgi:hypothetical protein